MAKKGRSGGRRYSRKRRTGRRGFRIPKLMDISQSVANARSLGYLDAGAALANGEVMTAGNIVADKAASLDTMLDLTVTNVVIGVNRKMARAFGGSFVRRYIA